MKVGRVTLVSYLTAKFMIICLCLLERLDIYGDGEIINIYTTSIWRW